MEADPPELGAELALLGLVALSVAAVVAAMLARRQLFLGSFDSEQIFGQGHALLQAWASGTSISTRAFLDLPLPLTYSPLEHAFSMPLLALSRLTNPWFAFNLMALCTLFANGLSMYGLLRVGGLCRPAAAVGGFLFFTAPTLLVHTYQDAYLGQAFYINIMFALQLRDRRAGFRAAHWGLLGACAALLAGAHEYLGLMGLGLLAVFLFCSARRLGARRLAVAVAASMFVFVVVEAPVLWMYAEQRVFDRENHVEFARPIEHSVVNSCLPRDYLFPRTYHPMLDWRGLAQESSQTGESAPYLGVINLSALLLLGMWALWRRDRVRAWLDASPLMTTLRCELLLCGVGGFLLTLGPRWRTAPWIPLPVELLRLLSPFQMVRGWGRFAMVVYFVATVLTAHLIDFLLRRRTAQRSSSTRLAGLVALLLCTIAVVDQVPVVAGLGYRLALPTTLDVIWREPGDFLVLHLPLTWVTGPNHNGRAQVLQAFHGKRTVNGYDAFLPERYADRLQQTPLRPLVLLAPQRPAVPTETLARWLLERDVRFVIYEHHTQAYVPPVFTEQHDVQHRVLVCRVLRELELQRALTVIEDDDDYTVYRVNP